MVDVEFGRFEWSVGIDIRNNIGDATTLRHPLRRELSEPYLTYETTHKDDSLGKARIAASEPSTDARTISKALLKTNSFDTIVSKIAVR